MGKIPDFSPKYFQIMEFQHSFPELYFLPIGNERKIL